MTYTYFPALRTKSGEANALNNLSSSEKDRICPILQIPDNIPPKFNSVFTSSWVNRFAILDGDFNTTLKSNAHDFLNEFQYLLSKGVTVSPCYVMGCSSIYENAIFSIPSSQYQYLSIRTNINDILNVIPFILSKKIPASSVVLIIDLGDISKLFTATFQSFIESLISQVINAESWQSVVLLSGAAPKDHSLLAGGRNTVPRLDWILWQYLVSKHSNLHFGDYLTLHPDLTSPPGFAITRATVSVRYTCDDEWLIYKGVQTSGPKGIKMTTQYIQHAGSLVGEPKFGSLSSSWADTGITHTASLPITSLSGAGGRERWVTYALNRHMAVVTAQLP
ncbi:beta family protein [Gluconobacter frateurii]|uniref:beta family protein n=1 Tax=Gluconobacter frateurii TaxID=38308 RepID=UPI001F0571D3|nr:beta family protein [Gluconobacter frateurii]UMM08450.1 beta family protein [Gluconobacter frateurii]